MEIIDIESNPTENSSSSEFNKPLLEEGDYDKINVMICTPCYGGKMDQATVSGMIGTAVTALSSGIKIDLIPIPTSV